MNNEEKRGELFLKINEAVKEAVDFVEKVFNGKDARDTKYIKILDADLRAFLKFSGTELLYNNLHKYMSSGRNTVDDNDYNLITKYKVDGEYKSLSDCIDKIYSALDDYDNFMRTTNF